MMKNTKCQRGFTLIELLVVVAILGILSSVGMGQFFTAQKRGRDSQRKENLESIARALEMYYNDYGRYPAATDGKIMGINWGNEFTDEKTIYMKQLPVDPADNFQYYYVSEDGTDFKLYALLEHSDDPGIKRKETGEPDYYDGTVCQKTGGSEPCNYCVASPNAKCD